MPTNTPLTDEELAELEAAAKAATPGPWHMKGDTVSTSPSQHHWIKINSPWIEAVRFAVIVVSKEAKSGVQGAPVMTQEGDRFWVLEEPGHWVEATSCQCFDSAVLPGDLKTFSTREKAGAFATRWDGHPWWCRPTGEYEIVSVRPDYAKPKRVGWRRDAAAMKEPSDAAE
jgi:hypothetical protein